MTIEKKKDGSHVELILNGWMDTQNAPLLEAELEALESDVDSLTLDMSGMEYCSSAGLRQIMAANRRMNGALTLRHVDEKIMILLRMSGLESYLNIEP